LKGWERGGGEEDGKSLIDNEENYRIFKDVRLTHRGDWQQRKVNAIFTVVK
jgi:hypothetical protein